MRSGHDVLCSGVVVCLVCVCVCVLCCCFVFFLMIRRPPRSTLDRSSAASDVYKRQVGNSMAIKWGIPMPICVRATADSAPNRCFPTFPRSVSYTHLRAHETVLDLVCRLLLEKKKKKTQHKRTHKCYKLTQTMMIANAS